MDDKTGILGIDAGGTFTDLVFLSKEKVEASVKVPTKHDDLLATIDEGIKMILGHVEKTRIANVHLASTLATNATVENKTAPSGLILIGYDARDIKLAVEKNFFGAAEVESASGGHDEKGNEKEPLDEKKILGALDSFLKKDVRGIAVSGYFSVRNPTHEIRAKELLKARCPGISITCGHELVSELDAFKRATTAAINAGLIPIVMQLLEAVKNVLKTLGINAPLSILKGDGSLVSAEWAESHPIETVVSGPAASAMGARFLSGVIKPGSRPSWVIDIGGTTTDIICLDSQGNPVVRNEGANIGGHDILIKTIDIKTFGLGGDSRVARMKDGNLTIGPRRVTPLAVAAAIYPEVAGMLSEIEKSQQNTKEPIIILPGRETSPANSIEERIMNKLRKGPAALEYLAEGESVGTAHSIGGIVDKLDERGAALISAFTPTDALIVLNKLDKWKNGASLAGARILAANPAKAIEYGEFCEEVCGSVSRKIAREVFLKAMLDEGLLSKNSGNPEMMDIGLHPAPKDSGADIILKLNGNMIGVGAPAWAFIRQAAAILSEEAILPENASVGGAVGAAVGTFFLRHSLHITPMTESGGFRVHLPDGIRDFGDLEEAVSESVGFMIPWLEALALQAGGTAPNIEWTRMDEVARVSGGTRAVHLWTRIIFSVKDKENA